MSMIPRRTAEFADGLNQKQERISRKVQPIRRTSRERSSQGRSSSVDNLSKNQLNPYITPLTVKKKRSTSATPLRTPLRTGRLTESGLILTSSKKEEDKKLIQEKALKLTEYIEKNVFKSNDSLFSHNNGLKSISIKQFITITNHFLKLIFGNRLSIGVNYIDELPKILAQVNYPYNVKSWLKTPTAPHAYHHIVTLFDWLMSFIINENDENNDDEGKGFDYKYIDPGDQFISKEYTRAFLIREHEGFTLWNNTKDDEVEKLKKYLMDDLIFRKSGISGIQSLEKKVNEIKSQIDGLNRNRCVIKNEKIFFRKTQEIEDKQKILLKLENEYEEKSKRLKIIKEHNENKLEIINMIKKRVHKYEDIIKLQKMNIQERNDLIEEINYLKKQLDIQNECVKKLQDISSNNQITFARLLTKNVENIAKFNNFINKIFSGFNSLNTLNINDMILDQNSDETIENQLNRIVPILKNLKNTNYQEYKYYEDEIKKYEKLLNELIYIYDNVLKDKLIINHNHYKELELQIKNIDSNNFEKIIQIQKKIELNQIEIRTLQNEHEKHENTYECKRIENEKYKIENEEILKEITVKFKEILNEKAKYIEKLKSSVNQFAKTMEDIEKSFRNEDNV